MGRKAIIAISVLALAVAVFLMIDWIDHRKQESEVVGYSPLFNTRVENALVPITSQVAYAGLQSLAAPCQTLDCETQDDTCADTRDQCQTLDCETNDCPPETSDCPTKTSDCPHDPTYDEMATCAEYYTCADTAVCDNGGTLDNGVACDNGSTVDGIAGCDGWTVDSGPCGEYSFAGPGCEGATVASRTCLGGLLVVRMICDRPTMGGKWCRPTYDGPTCYGPTCEGPTCFEEECPVWDFGDAPDGPGDPFNYMTLLENDGARHQIDGVYFLGMREDAERDGRPNELADGDDDPAWSSEDDEDGVWFVTTLVPGQPAVAIVETSREGHLNAWVDLDVSGNWLGENDKLFDEPQMMDPGFNWIWFTVPEDLDREAVTYARFRFGGGQVGRRGETNRGEVEDYRLVVSPDLQAWILTNEVYYIPGEEIEVTFFVSDVAQVTLIQHRSDGTTEVLSSSTFEPGRHTFPGYGAGRIPVEPPFGIDTIELIATSLRSGSTVWLTTPYRVMR